MAPDDATLPRLIGRDGVLAALVALLGDEGGAAAALVVGEAGIGKTALVERFAADAIAGGHAVAWAAGGADMVGRAYAALRRLLITPDGRHRVDLAGELPDGQQAALRAVLSDSAPAQRVDLLALRLAACSAFEMLAGDRPLVLVVDDIDRVDVPSFDLLLTVASVAAWGQLRVVCVYACRDDRLPIELAELMPRLQVPPLSDREAEALLARLPDGPHGSARQDVVRRAGGNPLALLEFARSIRTEAGQSIVTPVAEGRSSTDEPNRVVAVYADRVRALPEPSLRALTYVAVGEREIAVIARTDPQITLRDWHPAEAAQLVTVGETHVAFRHPLVEYAVLLAVGPVAQRRAHELLGATAERPRALWHRAAAAEGSDRALAIELITASRDLDGAAAVTAVSLLERAAYLMDAAERGPVLLEAATRAAAVGRVQWAGEVLRSIEPALVDAQDQTFVGVVAALSAWRHTMRGDLNAAAGLMLAAIPTTPEVAGRPLGATTKPTMVGTASLPAFLLGRPDFTAALRRAVPLSGDPPFLFALAVADPHEHVRSDVLAAHGTEIGSAAVVGAAAMVLDEPEHAVKLLLPAAWAVVDGTASAVFMAAPGAAIWALIDVGRWTESEQLLVPLLSSPAAAETSLIRAGAYVQLAIVAYNRGQDAIANDLLARSRQELDVFEIPAFVIRLRWAQGMAAAAAGDHDLAYRLFRAACGVGGDVDHRWQLLPLPDLVAAAVRIDRMPEAAAIVEGFRRDFAGRWLSGRVRARLSAATALLVPEPASAAEALTAVHDPDSARRWPFEWAVLAVEYADRLRRCQQPKPARALLIDALDTFERLRATAWAARVSGDLRTGSQSFSGPRADPFAGLTPQQVQIARLAGTGLSNREIGERLFLSPRTIGSHLYRMFPILGVANRTQLSELVAAADRVGSEAEMHRNAQLVED